jgi:hypothetical protein
MNEAMAIPRRVATVPAIGLIGALLTGCPTGPRQQSEQSPASAPVARECAAPASSATLGVPHPDLAPAEFTTDGTPLYITASDFSHSGLFAPKVGRTTVYIGHVGNPPIWDRGSATITNADHRLDNVTEGGPLVRVQLTPGRYWVHGGANITIDGCTSTSVTDPKLAPPVTPATTTTTR